MSAPAGLAAPGLAALLLAFAAVAPAGVEAARVPLAAHRATYDLALASVQGDDTVAASGSMTYQVIDACTSWATQQQLRLRTVTREGNAIELVSDYATLEAKNGSHLSFDTKQRENGVVTQQLRGEALVDASGRGSIRYTLPHRSVLALPAGTLFPMAHTAAILQAAQAGAKSLAPVLFDGTGLDGAQDTYVTILDWHAAPSQSDQPALAALGSTRVHVAFFARTPATITPDYESAMRYFANGVADRLTMDFGDFTMRGTMRSFTLPKHPPHC